MRRLHLFLVMIVAMPLGGSAFAQPIMPAMNQPGTAAPNPADRAMMTGMQRMSETMSSARMTGDPDRDFVAMMMPHHQGAIDMARVELQYGKDASMRRLAHAIVAAQDTELDEMRRWQAMHPAR